MREQGRGKDRLSRLLQFGHFPEDVDVAVEDVDGVRGGRLGEHGGNALDIRWIGQWYMTKETDAIHLHEES